MTHRAMASRPGSQAGNGPSSLQRAQSRFLEGSMNDRTSAMPPPNFLGPEEATIYEQQFYEKRASTTSQVSASSHQNQQQPPQQQQQQRRPGTAIGEVSKRGSTGFFAPLWDGMREKLSLTRSRSSNSIMTAGTASKIEDKGKENRISAPFPILQPQDPASAASSGKQPSREEILQNYQNLVASGFFSSHAIQSTRQPPPGQHQQQRPHTASRNSAPANHSFAQRLAAQEMPAPDRAPPPPPAHMSPPKTATYSAFPPPTRPAPTPFAIPYAATKPASFEPSSLPTPTSTRPSMDYDTMPSPNRGTKRSHAAVELASAEPSETGARKLAKKLRKSASRVSVDLSLAKTRSRPSTATTATTTTHSGGPTPAITPRSSMSIMRSWSASWRNSQDGGSSSRSSAVNNGAGSSSSTTSGALARILTANNNTSAEPERTERNKLKKREIRGRRVRRNSSKSPARAPPTRQRSGSRGRGRRSSSPCALPIMRPSTRDGAAHYQQQQEPVPFTHTNPLRAHPTHHTGSQSADAGDGGGGDAMEGVEFVVPSFHYPQRMRPGLPLSVVPDANRGIPQIPRIPAQYNSKMPAEAAGRETNDENSSGAWGQGVRYS